MTPLSVEWPKKAPYSPVERFKRMPRYPTSLEQNNRCTGSPDKVWNREEELENLNKMMEEMAGDKSEYGKRQPGERGMYEIQRMEKALKGHEEQKEEVYKEGEELVKYIAWGNVL